MKKGLPFANLRSRNATAIIMSFYGLKSVATELLQTLNHQSRAYIISQDFECNTKLKNETIEFLEDIICTSTLLPSEHRASSQLLRMLTKEEPTQMPKINLDALLTSLEVC